MKTCVERTRSKIRSPSWTSFSCFTYETHPVWDGSPAAGRYLVVRWEVWRHTEVGCTRNRTLGGQHRGYPQECPRGARITLKDYSDNEAVRSRGQGLVSTPRHLDQLSCFLCCCYVDCIDATEGRDRGQANAEPGGGRRRRGFQPRPHHRGEKDLLAPWEPQLCPEM